MALVRYFAAAAEAAGRDEETVSAASVGEVLTVVSAAHGAALERVLARCSFLVAGRRIEDPATSLTDADTLDVLPPFAGG